MASKGLLQPKTFYDDSMILRGIPPVGREGNPAAPGPVSPPRVRSLWGTALPPGRCSSLPSHPPRCTAGARVWLFHCPSARPPQTGGDTGAAAQSTAAKVRLGRGTPRSTAHMRGSHPSRCRGGDEFLQQRRQSSEKFQIPIRHGTAKHQHYTRAAAQLLTHSSTGNKPRYVAQS